MKTINGLLCSSLTPKIQILTVNCVCKDSQNFIQLYDDEYASQAILFTWKGELGWIIFSVSLDILKTLQPLTRISLSNCVLKNTSKAYKISWIINCHTYMYDLVKYRYFPPARNRIQEIVGFPQTLTLQ